MSLNITFVLLEDLTKFKKKKKHEEPPTSLYVIQGSLGRHTCVPRVDSACNRPSGISNVTQRRLAGVK